MSKRVDKDIPMSIVLILFVIVTIFTWLYFRFIVLADLPNATGLSIIAITITLVISFLFISVSAWAVAMISVTPISGMTLMTLMVTAVIFSQLGMTGEAGMLATLLIGGVVCTALSMAGSLVTQFKLGYWLGSTPKSIEWANIFGCVVASLVVTAVIILLAQVYGFSARSSEPVIAASPPALMETVVDSTAIVEGDSGFIAGEESPVITETPPSAPEAQIPSAV
ncbi:MAG: OPT/YSL family transporter [FCB group bacterium]|nr:OPT/YSL family transporter [FCB group bacterium]